ncbi:MAG: hypothetical protein Q8K50_14085, partial [Hydrogenophaga sp.]|nr:hypothetical protein [Hydrogenophaga sp.]
MTAEAPSPPNPMQSLRERLIQEGSIVPSQANAAISQNPSSELAETIKEKLEKIFSVLSEARNRLSAFAKSIQEFADKFSRFDLASRSCCSHFRLLGFLNLHRILDILVKHQDKRIRNFIVVRAG